MENTDHAARLEDLRDAAVAGRTGAMAELASRLLVGRDAPMEPEEGVALLEKALQQGDADAACLLATLAAAGAWTAQSWPRALDLLQFAAERGAVDARDQLGLLSSDASPVDAALTSTAQEDGYWQRIRDSVNLEAWVMPPPLVQVWTSPRIWTAERFASTEVCKWLVRRSQGKFKPALMFDGQRATFKATRTNSDFVFDIVESGVVMLLLRIKISALTGLPVSHMEPPQIFHYALGQEIKAHYDFLYDGERGYGKDGGYQGDRLATFLMYLNDDYDGGVLEFPKVGYRYRGVSGDGVFFTSQVSGVPDKQSLHAALPVTRGEKYILSQWIHDRPFTVTV